MTRLSASSIATAAGRSYWPGMAAMRLFRLLTLAALLLAPFGMLGSHAMATIPVSASGGRHMEGMAPDHCGGMDQPSKDRPSSSIDCMIACSALACAVGEFVGYPLSAAVAPEAAAPPAIHGLNPEADPPPPRLA